LKPATTIKANEFLTSTVLPLSASFLDSRIQRSSGFKHSRGVVPPRESLDNRTPRGSPESRAQRIILRQSLNRPRKRA